MAQYINKDALVEEISKRLLPVVRDTHYDEWERGQDSERMAILNIINTLKVKEVELDEEICSFFSKNPIPYEHITDWPLLKNCAIHFFELGLQARKPE